MTFLNDKAVLKQQLGKWSDFPGLVRLIPCHDAAVTNGAGAALKDAFL